MRAGVLVGAYPYLCYTPDAMQHDSVVPCLPLGEAHGLEVGLKQNMLRTAVF